MKRMPGFQMIQLPSIGGLTGAPPVLRRVNDFLSHESNCDKVNRLFQEDDCILQYESVIDCLLVELKPEFKDECFEFYKGKGKPLAELYSAETIEDIDRDLGLALEALISNKWPSWTDFKEGFRAEIKWEPL